MGVILIVDTQDMSIQHMSHKEAITTLSAFCW